MASGHFKNKKKKLNNGLAPLRLWRLSNRRQVDFLAATCHSNSKFANISILTPNIQIKNLPTLNWQKAPKTYTKLHRVMTWSSGISLNFTYEVLSPCYFALYPGIGWPELSNAEAEICSLTHKLHRRLWTSNIYIWTWGHMQWHLLHKLFRAVYAETWMS